MDKKDEVIYCVECGEKNAPDTEKCTKCHKNPDPKDHAWKDYWKEKVGGKIEDNAFDLIKKYIEKHLYGVLMTCSVVFTGVSLALNVTPSNKIKEVDSKPEIKYLGEGLSPMELLEKYVSAAKENDVGTLMGLQLENTRPDIYEEISHLTDNSSPSFGEKKPIKTHTVSKFRDIYFRDNRVYSIEPSRLEVNSGKYGDYDYERYELYLIFCENNECGDPDAVAFDSYRMIMIVDQIEVVLVDRNYYIIGEKHHYEHMNLSDVIERGIIYNAKGDMTKVDVSSSFDILETCDDAEECFSKYGGMEAESEW